jgi:hypothetical protein
LELRTVACGISFITAIERDSSEFYEKWGNRHEESKAAFLGFAKENVKNVKNIKRSYFGVVSDALEINFCFKGLEAKVEIPSLGDDASPSEILKASISLEDAIRGFYGEASECSKGLLADVPRAMARVSKAREARIERLQSMLASLEEDI